MNSSTELDAMGEMNELDDLGNLFEFGDIDLNNIPDPSQYGDPLSQQHITHPNTPFQDMSEAPPMSGTTAHDFGGNDQFSLPQTLEQAPYTRQREPHVLTSNPYTSEPMYQPSLQQAYSPYAGHFNFQPQSGFPPGHHVPPTPNSYEMHGETAHFMQSQQQMQMDPQQRAILEQRYRVRKDDAIAFTPMVSPAGTPQYSMIPEYTTPGAYFSPLSSPMLHAQNSQHSHLQHAQQQGYLTNPSTAPSSNTNSPIDPALDVDMLDGTTLPEPGQPSRRSRRKIAPHRNAAGSSRTRQSPAQGPQKRKSAPLSSSHPFSAAENSTSHTIAHQPAPVGFQMPPRFDSSEAESISPEPFGDSRMGPPPRPGSSLARSPALAAQHQQKSGIAQGGPAATPKSLLTMRGGQQPFHGQQSSPHSYSEVPTDYGGLDDLSLPEAANSHGRRKPSLTQINTQLMPSADDDSTPRHSARKTPKLGPLSTPASVRPGSATGSPSIVGSPMPGSTPSAILKDKKDSRAGRGSKKRGSMSASSSKLVSPALVPKISPSIKPLLPEGTPLNTATQALLLASKSNYQNLLEGNHLPGVNYPDSLSTGLTSKRTSHKVAEQGRRNRINEALKEMQSLIPKPSLPTSITKSAGIKESSSPEDGNSAETGLDAIPSIDSAAASTKDDNSVKSNNSKAATVELANEYIRKMQKDRAAQTAELEQLKHELDELRKRLGEHRSSAEDSPMDGGERMASEEVGAM